jgi:hypothetical protein
MNTSDAWPVKKSSGMAIADWMASELKGMQGGY